MFAASIDDLIACHQNRPVIVHFAGHGEERHLVFVRDRDPLVETMRLHQEQANVLFRNFPERVRLVVFNTCHSLDLARHLVANNVIDMAVGFDGKVPDDQAVRFAATFYRQLADGRPVKTAYELAGMHLGDQGASIGLQLLHAPGIDPARATFAPLPWGRMSPTDGTTEEAQ